VSHRGQLRPSKKSALFCQPEAEKVQSAEAITCWLLPSIPSINTLDDIVSSENPLVERALIVADHRHSTYTGENVNSTREFAPPVKSAGTLVAFRVLVGWSSNLPAVLFNTGFAILAIVTLCGIVFITKPKVVMHDISPEMWLPLLVVMAPAQIYAQFLSWSTVFAGQIPTGPAIVLGQMKIPGFLKPIVALLWLCNFCVGFGIVVSLSKPHPGNPPPSFADVLLILILASWLAFAAIVYLLLAIKTYTPNENVLHRVWSFRFLIGLAMGVFAAIYYGL
jgi:hypothetical protein